jgi:hypothetical protein
MATSWEAYKKKRKQGDESPTSSWNSYAASKEADKLIRTTTSPSKKVEEEDIAPIKSSEDRSWFKSGAFSDGYQFGDITKTILGTAGNVADSLATGVAKIGEGAINSALYVAGGVADLKGDKVGSGIAKALISTDKTEIAKSINNSYRSNTYYGGKLDEQKYIEENTVLGDKSSSLVQSAGQLAGTIGLQAVGVPWWATTGVTSFGSGTQEAFGNDATYGEAGAYGLISAGAEVLTEKLGGITFGGKSLLSKATNGLTEGITNHTIKTLAKFGIDALGEGGEEVLTEVIQNVGKKLTYEDEQTWKEILASPEALDAYLESFIGGAVLGGGSSAINSIRSNNDIAPVENEAQVEGLQQALEEKQQEQNQAQDPREQQIIQEEIEVLQEELIEATNAQQITDETIQTEEKVEEVVPVQETVQTNTPDIKTKQLEIIQKTNPMQDDYHVGIRSIEDIKTFDETINDDESFVWGDFSQEDAKNALNKGTVTVYSSKPIENGNFVSTSKNMARDYAGGGKVYSKEVPLNEVAWISGDEGQYAKVDTQQITSEQLNTEVNSKQDAPMQDITEQETIDEDIIPETQEEIKIGKEWTNKVKEQDEVNRPLAIEQSKTTGNNTMVGYSPILSNNKLYHKGTLSWVTPEGKLDSKVINESEIDNFLSKNKIDRLENGISPFDNGLSEVVAPLQEAIENLTEQVKAIQENIAPITEVNNNDRISETNVSTEENQTARGEYQDTDTIKQYKQEVEKYIKSNIKENFGFKNKDVDDIYNKIASKENPTIDDIYSAFKGHREIKVAPDKNYIAEIKEIKDAVRNTRLQISDEVRQIPDWNDFRKANFATLKLSNDGVAVDIFYQELANMYPEQFDSSITNQADQVLALSDFMRSNTNTILNAPEIYNLTDSDLSEVANYIYDGLQSVRSFEESLQNIAPDVQESPTINQNIQEQQLIPTVEEIAQNPFELTAEQNARIQELRDDTEKWKQVYNERYDDKKFAQKRIKGVAMQNAAEIRKITQGDLLIPIEGGLTENELSALKNKLRNNYVGKQVLVDGKEGTVVGNAYGKIGVEFEDGTKQYVNKNLIQPLEDIDSIIQEQQRMYEQYKATAPDVQESPTINQNAQEQQLIPMAETTAQNQNTELSDTSTETQEQEKVAEILSERPTQENKKQRLWAKFRAGVFDKGSVFEDLSIKNKNRELMSKWDYMLTAEARAQSVMINGHKQFDSETKTETQTTKSLNDIQTEVGDKVQEFSEYLYHKHNISRMSLEANAQARMTELQETALAEYDTEAIEKLSRKRITEKTDEETATLIETAKEYVRLSEVKNKPVFGKSVTADISKEIVNEYEMNNPEFMDWAKDVYDYNNANLDQLVQGGVISQETADQFAEIYPDYVPIGRANKNGNAINVPLDTNRTTINTPIKGAKGGNGDILPLFDTIAKRTLQTYRAVAKNNFGVELKNTLKGNTINQTTNIDEVLDNVDQQESLLQEGKDGKAPTFTVFENGKKVTYEITQDMYEALKPVSDSSLLSTTFKPFNKISNFHRGVLTEYNPVFMLTNSIKDFQDVLLNSQHAAKTYSKFGESYAQILKKGYWYKEYMANGGEQNSYFDSQEGTFNPERKGMAKVLDTFPLKQISQLNNVIEMAPRLAEYIASREAGRSIETSMLDAARVTTNFKAGGDLTKWANRNGATFLNASIQGAMQQVRNVREANMNGLKGYANLATKFALAGVPAMILNAMLWGDDEEYEELSDYVKQSYWIVGKYGDGNFIRIPKGRMVTVIQESFNQMKNAITGNDEADLGQFLEVMATNIAPNNPIENNVLSPIIGAVTNKAWYGDDLVPTRLQNVPAEEQYDESIDKLSIALGQKLGISPYKINYVLDQYSGGIGDTLLPMMTPQAETSSDSIGSKLISPLTSKFGVDSVMKNQNTSDLYTLSEELTTKANSSKATDEDILKNKFINTAKAAMNELYKQKREIQNSDIPDSQKYNQVREIQKQINEMAASSIRDYEDIDMKSNYADVGGVEYYKNNDGEWTKVRDKEALELNELGMTSSTKNTYFETKNEINKLAGIVEDSKDSITIEDEDSDEYKEAVKYLSSEKKKDIVDKIIDSGLKDKEKAYLYKKFYNSDTVDTMVNTGISVDDYLIYTTKEFKADYNYKGNAIPDSRKNKVVSYVNSLEMTIPQKAILIKSTNTFKFNDYNNAIVSYVSDLDLDYKEKVKLLKDLDMTVTDDGTVEWK